ncbi:hypothetical protein FACS189432_05640 [Bacteroidia bacterium]|nr:hypothetical protein FACS189426_14090 [Bacteroidia bacterium]GHT28130.1 hypothetical protein FACS189432_05640 [Bacteroidia bacterium]
MKKTLLSMALCLTISILVINVNAQNKAAILSTYTSLSDLQINGDDDEYEAANWFVNTYGGDFLSTADVAARDLSQYKVLWIAIDRVGTGNGLPNELTATGVLNKIKTYYQAGGNLLLTNHATRYLVNLGRTTRLPGISGEGTGSTNTDDWGVNSVIGSSYDHSGDFLYAGMTPNFTEGTSKKVYNLIASGYKEDHNSMWDLNAFDYTGNPNIVVNFETENNATVLGTWQHVTDYCCAGIVDFHKTVSYGRCIAIGLAAYEWNQNSGTNPYQSNIQLLTKNALDELTCSTCGQSEPQEGLVLVAHFPMEINANTKISEIVANKSFTVEQVRPVRENIAGAVGQALRFDGNSTFVNAQINVNNLNNQAVSMELWAAMENYPMMNTDGNNTDFTVIAGNMKTSANSGFAFVVNTRGEYGFQVYIDGNLYSCIADAKFPLYSWAHVQAVVSVASHKITLYYNGVQAKQTTISGAAISVGSAPFSIGKSYNDIKNGNFYLNTVCGLIDEIKVYSGELAAPTVTQTPENTANLAIPASRFEDEIQRPLFRGMPAAAWTNEPHGLIFHNGKWHLFFQKNGNGAYWGQIVWGHITSTDLVNWTEEQPSLYNDKYYDIKGVWSGCIFKDDSYNNGKPTIFYTSVDFAKASMVMATPADDDLHTWTKNGQVVPQRPAGLDDDFRDPCVFKANGNIYMLVGSNKGGRGAATLHRYNAANNTWTNDGAMFFQSPNTSYGTFWEMPYIVEMEANKWLFVVTPLGMAGGVECLYWVGTINTNGTFSPTSQFPKELDLGGFSHHGFGLLSPAITKHNGKIVAIGIVPDMTSGNYMYERGWAGTYNLPREWSLDAQNNLVQKPATDMTFPRSTANVFNQTNISLSGTQSLNPVSGKVVEVEGIFTVSSNSAQKFGFNLRKNGSAAIKIFYEKSTNKIIVDATSVPRHIQDGGVFDGIYSQVLPKTFSAGETLKIHAFLDHSILDLFINDAWAASVRIFATDNNANDVEVFTEGGATQVQSVKAWNWEKSETGTGIFNVRESDKEVVYYNNALHFKNISENAKVNIYDLFGKMVFCRGVARNAPTMVDLPKNQIFIVRINDNGEIVSRKIITN